MKIWTIIFENEYNGQTKPIVFQLTSRLLKYISISVSVFFIFAFSIFVIAKIYNLDPNAKYALNAKRAYLINEIVKYNQHINLLISDMQKIIDIEKKTRTLANLNPLPEDIRRLGIGGYEINDKRIKPLNKQVKHIINNLDSRLYQAKNIINFEGTNIEDIKINFEEQCNLLKHKPSIMPTRGWITSKYGPRFDPIYKKKSFHAAIDIANDYNTPIFAPANGKVIFVGKLPGYGNVLKIDHGYGYITVYAHLNKILVKKNANIKRHQKIALMGNTGKSTGPHLHYEVRIFNKKVNPFEYIDEDTVIK